MGAKIRISTQSDGRQITDDASSYTSSTQNPTLRKSSQKCG